ncbi:terminase small subunit [Escherichia coli]|uniref:terminase small subunit n=1 Tax=Escherichia coli TaxID=562 RepID=UPI002D1E3733|nr:terminase small subunit [Escherichia coli]
MLKIENEKLRREDVKTGETRRPGETRSPAGTIEYERHVDLRVRRPTQQELKKCQKDCPLKWWKSAFCTLCCPRMRVKLPSILDGIPLSVQRRFSGTGNRDMLFPGNGISINQHEQSMPRWMN